MSSTVNELTSSLKDAKDKCDKLNEANRELKDRLVKSRKTILRLNLIMIIFLLKMNFYLAIHMRLLTLLLRLT
jgi:wobble nucleotide-excising tRNase